MLTLNNFHIKINFVPYGSHVHNFLATYVLCFILFADILVASCSAAVPPPDVTATFTSTKTTIDGTIISQHCARSTAVHHTLSVSSINPTTSGITQETQVPLGT